MATYKSKSDKLDSWLQLLRAPNLLTVPGDAAAGCALAAAWKGIAPPLSGLLIAALCSLLFYMYGLILNDVVDVRADRRNRNGRPLAEGDIPVILALTVCIVLGALGLFLASFEGKTFFIFAVLLCGTITAYNLLLKRFPIPGSAAMGLCRALSLMLGAVTIHAYAAPAILAALGLGVFIACVTWIADHEEEFFDFDRRAFFPLYGYAAALVLPLGLIAVGHPGKRLLFCLIPLAFGLIRVIYISNMLSKGSIPPGVTQRSIGSYIRALIPMQAAFLMMGFGFLTEGLGIFSLIFLWPTARVLAHRFYAS